MDFDLVIGNGIIVDGTGEPRYRGNVGISGGRIAAVTGEPLSGARFIDAEGLVVSPGFIDVHSHSDWIVPLADHDRILAPFVLQGVTTIVGGNCGTSPSPVTDSSVPTVDRLSAAMRGPGQDASDGSRPYFGWRTTAEYLDHLEQQGVLLNTAVLAGHGTLRAAVLGDRADAPDSEALSTMKTMLRGAMNDGAFGMSVGLAFVPGVFAQDEELAALLSVLRDCDGLWAIHGHTYSWVSPFYPSAPGLPHNQRDVRRHVSLAAEAGVRLQLSHMLFKGRRTWPTYRDVLGDIERARAAGLDVAFDAIPYHWGNSLVNVLFPGWFLDGFDTKIDDPAAVARLREEVEWTEKEIGRDFCDITLLWGGAPELRELEGLDVSAIAQRMGVPAIDAYIHIARASQGKARIRTASYSGEEGKYEEPLWALLSHPLCSFELDTMLSVDGARNPASYGGFPRVLGRYSRELQLFPLEDAVRRSTKLSAERVGLKDLGTLEVGKWADVVIFNPDTIADNTSVAHPDAAPTGVDTVLISGEVVAQDGRMVNQGRHGRVLRH